MKFLGQGEHEQDRQIDRHTHRHTHRQTRPNALPGRMVNIAENKDFKSVIRQRRMMILLKLPLDFAVIARDRAVSMLIICIASGNLRA